MRKPSAMKKYRCTVCFHIYHPEEGDPASGIPPGTAFEDIPDTWVCPDCGATKADFEPLDDDLYY
jgi:rubredoxin